MNTKRLLPVLIGLSGLLSLPALAQADYPNRPIKFVLGTGAGSGADAVARLVSDRMGQIIKGSIVVENKPGAGGAIAAEFVAKSPADGYTMLLGGYTQNVLLPAMNPKLPYNTVKDFVAIGSAASAVTLLVAVPNYPASNLKELVALAKSSTPSLQYATWGNGSTGHFCGELLKYKKQIDMDHIPYKTTPQVLNDLLAGHIKLAYLDMATALPVVRSGKIKAVGSCTSRSAALPTLNSYDDEGIDVDGMQVTAPKTTMYFPAGTPKPIVDKMSAALKSALDMPDVKARISELGNNPEFMSGEELMKTVASDTVAWRKIAQKANITAD